MSRARTSNHRLYSDVLGREVMVHVTPMSSAECDHEGKTAARVAISLSGTVLWAPDAPLCLGLRYDSDSPRGRHEAARAALDFFEHELVERNPGAPIEIGTLIHATLRTQDLVTAFLDELERIDPSTAAEIRSEYGALLASAKRDRRAWQSDEAHWLLDGLFDALNERAPEGLYFGAHPGDGSDFGWWPAED